MNVHLKYKIKIIRIAYQSQQPLNMQVNFLSGLELSFSVNEKDIYEIMPCFLG